MDPLSISMSILTIIGSATATVKVTKSFYNAAEEIDFLLNDLTEADIMFRDIQSSLQNDENNGYSKIELESLLREKLKVSEISLLEIQALVNNEVRLGLSTSSVYKRLSWLRVLRKTKKSRKKLAEAHSKLPQCFGQLQNQRMRLEVNSIGLSQGHVQSSLSRLKAHAIQTRQTLNELEILK